MTARFSLPKDDDLRAHLVALGHEVVRVIERRPNPYSSSCPSELVALELDGQQRTWFCKYGQGAAREQVHRQGVGYEAAVYRDVLAPASVSAPAFHGCFEFEGNLVLVIDALQDAQPITKAGAARLVEAATWLGRFHRAMVGAASAPANGFLRRYDLAHFAHWLRQAEELVAEHALDVPWLPSLRARYLAGAAALSDHPTVVHGELYPLNLLVTAHGIHPIDWESAGVGAGEIDLACLTMGWPDDVVGDCTKAYGEARGAVTKGREFDERMATVRVYLALRMIGNNRQGRGDTPFFDYLRDIGVAVGFLDGSRRGAIGGG